MGGGYAARLFLLFSFSCSADHERDRPSCKVVFFGLATNTLNVRDNNNNNIFSPEGGCSEGLDALRFSSNNNSIVIYFADLPRR